MPTLICCHIARVQNSLFHFKLFCYSCIIIVTLFLVATGLSAVIGKTCITLLLELWLSMGRELMNDR